MDEKKRPELKGLHNKRTLSQIETDIFDGIRILRGGALEKEAYKLREQEGFEIRKNGRELYRRSIIEVDGELFTVALSMSKTDMAFHGDEGISFDPLLQKPPKKQSKE